MAYPVFWILSLLLTTIYLNIPFKLHPCCRSCPSKILLKCTSGSALWVLLPGTLLLICYYTHTRAHTLLFTLLTPCFAHSLCCAVPALTLSFPWPLGLSYTPLGMCLSSEWPQISLFFYLLYWTESIISMVLSVLVAVYPSSCAILFNPSVHNAVLNAVILLASQVLYSHLSSGLWSFLSQILFLHHSHQRKQHHLFINKNNMVLSDYSMQGTLLGLQWE